MALERDSYNAYYHRTLELPPPGRCDWFLNNVSKGGSILDFGAGTGRYAAAFKRDRPDLEVDALEINPEALRLLKTRSGIHTIEQRFEHFKPSKNYDAVWAKDCLFFLGNTQLSATLGQLHAALKPGGGICASFIKADEKPNPSKMFLRHSEQELRELFLAAGFTIHSLKEFPGRFGANAIPATCFNLEAIRD